jgi:class 3 adenylate cyclase
VPERSTPWGNLLLVFLRQLRQRSMTDIELPRASRATRNGPAVYAITPEGVEAILARAGEGCGTPEQVTILFTGVVGSAELRDRVGDVAAHDLLRRHFAATGTDALELWVEIAAGEAAHEGEDYFGRPVIVARRLCDAAGAGEVLVAEGLGAARGHTSSSGSVRWS